MTQERITNPETYESRIWLRSQRSTLLVEHWTAKSDGLGSKAIKGTQIFSLLHACDKSLHKFSEMTLFCIPTLFCLYHESCPRPTRQNYH